MGGRMYELDGYRSAYFPLKRFEILDRSTGRSDPIYAPDYWRGELSDRDLIWIVHPHRDYRVQITFDPFRRHPETARQCRALLSSLVKGLEAGARTCPVTASQDGETGLIETVSDMGDGFHVFRLFRLCPRDDLFFVGQIAFEFKAELADAPETRDLIELFRSQLLAADPPDDLPIAEALPPPRSAAAARFRDLQEVEPYGFMELRVPSYWEAQEDEEGRVAYFDPDDEALTLFVNYVLILRFPDRGGELFRKVELSAREEEDRGGRLRRVKWMVSDSTYDRAMWAIVDLVMDAERADTPEFRELVGIMNDEVRRMRIGDPPASAEACAQPRRTSGAA